MVENNTVCLFKRRSQKECNLPSSAAIVGIGIPKIFENTSLIFDTNGPTSS